MPGQMVLEDLAWRKYQESGPLRRHLCPAARTPTSWPPILRGVAAMGEVIAVDAMHFYNPRFLIQNSHRMTMFHRMADLPCALSHRA